MANSVDPDQTAPIEAVCSGAMLFASMLNSSVMLGALRVKSLTSSNVLGNKPVCHASL